MQCFSAARKIRTEIAQVRTRATGAQVQHRACSFRDQAPGVEWLIARGVRRVLPQGRTGDLPWQLMIPAVTPSGQEHPAGVVARHHNLSQIPVTSLEDVYA